MPIDPAQFLQTYIDESLETLQDMETAILELNLEAVDKNKINIIFRTVHSLKSSSALLGFNSIGEFSHTLEDFLQLIRADERQLDKNDIELLLTSVDCIKKMISNVREKKEIDTTQSSELNEIFLRLLESNMSTLAEIRKPNIIINDQLPETSSESGWKINLIPKEDFFQTGTDVIRLFTALSELGQLDIEVDATRLPTLEAINDSVCYLSWKLFLHGNASLEDVQEIFSWVSEYVTITPVALTTEKPPIKEADKSKITEKAEAKPVEKSDSLQDESIRVSTKKVDSLIDLIGELIITQSTLNQITKDFSIDKINKLYDALAQLEFNSRDIQDNVLSIRMLPITFSFNRIPRYAHDMANKSGKKVELIMKGEQTEIDKNMMEKIFNPIIHLVRNAIDHGIEIPSDRVAKGKAAVGKINVSAFQERGKVVIVIEDDGAGLDVQKIRAKAIEAKLINETDHYSNEQIFQCIYQPGFSTNDSVSDISGRGVGMDVVYKSIKQLGGSIDIESKADEGTKFIIRLPITLSIMDCQLIRIGKQIYTVPLISIVENINIDTSLISHFDNKTDIYTLRGECIPIINVSKVFNIAESTKPLSKKYLIITEEKHTLFGLVVDSILDQQQVVVKSLDDNYCKTPGISGATILGDGSVALIIDTNEVVDLFQNPLALTHSHVHVRSVDKLDDGLKSAADSLDAVRNGKDNLQLLTFMLSDNIYGIDILEVKEIINLNDITPLPNAPSYIKGLLNLRGTIIPIVDLHNYFQIEKDENTNNKMSIIVLSIKSGSTLQLAGIIVDAVNETYSIPFENIKGVPDAPPTQLTENSLGLVIIDGKVITLLQPEKIIASYAIQSAK